MPRTTFPVEQLLTVLTETPSRMPAAILHAAPNDEWSANDVLAHLRACADVWGGNIATMLAEDKPTWRAINPRTWITRTDYLDLKFRPSLRAFTDQRTDLLALLQTMSP